MVYLLNNLTNYENSTGNPPSTIMNLQPTSVEFVLMQLWLLLLKLITVFNSTLVMSAIITYKKYQTTTLLFALVATDFCRGVGGLGTVVYKLLTEYIGS